MQGSNTPCSSKTVPVFRTEMEAKDILVKDLDPLAPAYKVVDEHGWNIGEKSRKWGYMKPEYTKNGRRTGGKHGSIEARFYKAAPPWLKFKVFQIDQLGGGITFHATAK